MIIDIVSCLLAADGGVGQSEAVGGVSPRSVVQVMRFWPLIAGPHLIALSGLALLVSLLFPSRHSLAVVRVRQAPAISFAVGLVVLVLIVGIFQTLKVNGIQLGQNFLIILCAIACALGFATSARALGERALPGRPAIAHTALGLAALILPLVSPVCLPILAVAPSFGLGAWLLAGRAKGATMP
ncbi:MAG: hypothetical protein H0V44_08260 [Planctomycetes bacterium]|nr:hypothetical protein [Planctomycetota bacterium]